MARKKARRSKVRCTGIVHWYGAIETNLVFAMKDSGVRQVELALFFLTESMIFYPLCKATAWRAGPLRLKRRVDSEFGEAVRCPLLRADSVVDEKDAVGIVFLFDFGEASVIVAPVSMFEGGFKEVAF